MSNRVALPARVVCVASAALLFPSLHSCVPWTIRPIQSEEQSAFAGPSTTDPVAYAASLWDSKLVPTVRGSAKDARELLSAIAASPDEAGRKFGRRDPGGPWQFMIQGEGRVVSVDTRSRNGILLIDVPPFDRRADVSIQIGPVLRGTSLRDATGIVQFGDFVNQIQFADFGNELNRQVSTKVLPALALDRIAGKSVSFIGTFTLEGSGEPPIRGVIPVQLVVKEQP